MGVMRWFVGISCAVATAAACSSFGDGDTNEPPAVGADAANGVDGAAEAAGGDATAGGDAGACEAGGRDGGNLCGATGTTCGKGQTCCLAQTPYCIDVNSCGT